MDNTGQVQQHCCSLSAGAYPVGPARHKNLPDYFQKNVKIHIRYLHGQQPGPVRAYPLLANGQNLCKVFEYGRGISQWKTA